MIDWVLQDSLPNAELPDVETLMVPSGTTRQYMKQTGYVLTDLAKAALIVNSNASLPVRYRLLEKLAAATADPNVQGEIEWFLKWQRQGLAEVPHNDRHGAVYYPDFGRWGERDPDVLFHDLEPAFQWAVAHAKGKPFDLWRVLLDDGVSKTQDNARLTFDGNGELMDFSRGCADENGNWNEEVWTFPSAFFDPPVPFDRGDIVWLLDYDEYGVVETTAESLHELAADAEHLDFGDIQMRVMVAGSRNERPGRVGWFSHAHVSPFRMERYDPSDWEAYGGFDGMLLAAQKLYRGTGSISTLRHYTEQHRSYREKMERQGSA